MTHSSSSPTNGKPTPQPSPGELIPLVCHVQHYSWGDTKFIPQLMGIENREELPYAELWMGAHPDLPATALFAKKRISLDELIAQDPEKILGERVVQTFNGRLPYLLKILSARRPLSIQSHPSRERAQAGFARENALKIPLSAPDRNYRDDNHKPEMIVALTEFFALRGFRPLPKIAQLVHQVPEFHQLMPTFQPTETALRTLYQMFMSLPPDATDAILDPLMRRLAAADQTKPFTRRQHEYWALRADHEFSSPPRRDRGLFSIFLMNLVELQPGQATLLPAGVLHAYLQGSGVEIMANSNNVLRGGLTTKHVDVPELINNVTFAGGPAEILRPIPMAHSPDISYPTSVDEFQLHRTELTADQSPLCLTAETADIFVVVYLTPAAQLTATCLGQTLSLKPGDAVLAPHRTTYRLQVTDRALLYRATVPNSGPSRQSTT